MLAGIDNWIIKHTNGKKFYADSTLLLQLTYYFTIRLKDQTKGSSEEYIFRELIIKFINELHVGKHDKLFQEPFSFSLEYQLPQYIYVLSKIYELDFYNYRIIKILEEISMRVTTYIPASQSHRLYLACMMKSITNQVEPGGWEKHIGLLKKEIELEYILNKEMLNCHVGITKGAGGIYLLSKLHNHLFEKEEQITISSQLFSDRINNSEIWESFEEDKGFFIHNRGLGNGLCGMLLLSDSLE